MDVQDYHSFTAHGLPTSETFLGPCFGRETSKSQSNFFVENSSSVSQYFSGELKENYVVGSYWKGDRKLVGS